MKRSFTSLEAFAAHVLSLEEREIVADTAGRTAVAKHILTTAKDMIGKPDRLPPPLAPYTVRERIRLGYTPYETLLRSGKLRDSYSWASEGSRATGVGSSSPYAPYHELGGNTPGRPPQRSVMVEPTKKHDRELFEMFVEVLFKILAP